MRFRDCTVLCISVTECLRWSVLNVLLKNVINPVCLLSIYKIYWTVPDMYENHDYQKQRKIISH